MTEASAAEIARSALDHQGGRYRIDFEARIAAEAAKVRPLLSDYNGLARLSETVIESQWLAGQAGAPRVRIVQRACIVIFCQTLRRTMLVEPQPDGDVLTLTEPETSDYREVREHWQVIAEAGQTRVRYRAEFVPRFFVPPLIGPWLVKSRLRAELEATAARIESLAAQR